MTGEHDRLAALFERASALAPSSRSAFLEQVGSGSPALRAELESLLAHAASPPALLDTGRLTGGDLTAPAPENVGPYRIVELLGEGGMGVVYRAEQERPLRREVALKLVRPGFNTGPVIARFESERQALALMDHPGIAHVLDAGTAEDGRPFFVMEYVRGLPITEHCDANRLGIDQRLTLFLRVCDAVQHAHQRAVIHRDLKPTNVLVGRSDGIEVPKIIDFGVAKALGEPLSTQPLATGIGQIVGTPAYMSPEQAHGSGAVDTRTDVYALGLVLYELLVGLLPFETGDLRSVSPLEAQRRILETEFAAPSARLRGLGPRALESARARGTALGPLLRRLRGDLDGIVLHSIEREPDRRYASVAELAADLRRHLDSEPVSARPPSLVYRAGKLARKHRTAASFGAVLLLSLLAFAVTATILAARARNEAALSAEVSQFLLGLFDASVGFIGRDDKIDAETQIDRSSEKVVSRLGGRPALQGELLRILGDVQRRAGRTDKAARLLENAVSKLEALAPGGPPSDALLLARDSQARLLLDTRQLDAAERLYRANLDERARRLGPRDLETLRTAANLAYLYKVAGRHDESEPLFTAAEAGMSQVLGPNHAETLKLRGLRDSERLEQRRYAEVAASLEALYEALPAGSEMDGERTILDYNLACAYAGVGRKTQAFEHLARAIEAGFIPGEFLESDPHLAPLAGDPEFESVQRFMAGAYEPGWRDWVVRGEYLESLGRADEAAPYYQAVLARARVVGRQGQPEALRACFNLARVRGRQERFAESESLLRSLLDPAIRNQAVQLWCAPDLLSRLAHYRLAQGDRPGALALLAQAESVAQPNDLLPDIVFSGACCLALSGDRAGALAALERAARLGFRDWGRCPLAFADLRHDPAFARIWSTPSSISWLGKTLDRPPPLRAIPPRAGRGLPAE